MTDKSPGTRIREGKQAELELEQTRAAFDAVRQELLDGFERSAPHETDVRERAYYMLLAVIEVRRKMAITVSSGKIEERNEELRRKKEQ